MSQAVSVTREIAAPPERVYAMVADLRRMGEWSPENHGGEWLDDVAEAGSGARFRGRNRNGRRSWTSVATVIDAEPGRRFSFRVRFGPVKVSDWSYSFEAVPAGCRVTESWLDLRPRWFRPIATAGTGVSDRPTHNRRTMEQTLERLAAAAESEAHA
ncbi:MAG TPA: SRPBCC family protein [Nocardioides sp.]|uniref:SRPBCC family protein n=1 Tax=Nocardioides sp. TaxID=35761 RepID=UPI002C179954|nr:SRPBCC family protein [Nocardioides sp.]HQR27174.1 SRPBCC family protein [Nocardioides sp.]